jgi:hypothetical protein
MKKLSNRLAALSTHLQKLSKPEYAEKIQQAVEKNDKATIVKICKSANIPIAYVGSIASIVLSYSPMKWPEAS